MNQSIRNSQYVTLSGVPSCSEDGRYNAFHAKNAKGDAKNRKERHQKDHLRFFALLFLCELCVKYGF